jgi:hypothetical protein
MENGAIRIDVHKKIAYFADGTELPYNTIISTLPLNTMLSITDIQLDATDDPFTSVLVLNLGAKKGRSARRITGCIRPMPVQDFTASDCTAMWMCLSCQNQDKNAIIA